MRDAERLARLSGIHDAIGKDLNDLGGILRCERCGTEEALSKNGAALYLRRGWPECCGYTMTWVTARQLASENS